jgi:uncharacterized membrane protein required for colicin V production
VPTEAAVQAYHGAAVSAIDIAIVVILLISVLLGWSHGLFRPLITWAFIIAGVVVGFGYPAIADRFAPNAGWRPVMGLVVLAVFAVVGSLVAHVVAPHIYRRIPGVGAIDRIGGVVVSLVLSLLGIFVLLSLMVTLDQAAAPVEGTSTISGAQISQIQSFLSKNPGTAIVLDTGQLKALETQLNQTPITAANIGQVNGALGALRDLHTQMVDSSIAPIIFDAGERIPILGDSRPWPTH